MPHETPLSFQKMSELEARVTKLEEQVARLSVRKSAPVRALPQETLQDIQNSLLEAVHTNHRLATPMKYQGLSGRLAARVRAHGLTVGDMLAQLVQADRIRIYVDEKGRRYLLDSELLSKPGPFRELPTTLGLVSAAAVLHKADTQARQIAHKQDTLESLQEECAAHLEAIEPDLIAQGFEGDALMRALSDAAAPYRQRIQALQGRQAPEM